MSYLHCPTCSCAYNVSDQPACPRCGIRAGAPEDPTDDVVAAVEQLARAMARATPSQIAAAEAMLDAHTAQLALPASTGDRASAAAPTPTLLRAVRAALSPPPAVPAASPDHPPSLTTVVLELLARLAATPPRPLVRALASGRSLRAWATTRMRALHDGGHVTPIEGRRAVVASLRTGIGRLAAGSIERARAVLARAA